MFQQKFKWPKNYPLTKNVSTWYQEKPNTFFFIFWCGIMFKGNLERLKINNLFATYFTIFIIRVKHLKFKTSSNPLNIVFICKIMTFALQNYLNKIFSIIVTILSVTRNISIICDVSTKSTRMIKYEIEKLYKKYDNISKHTNRIEKFQAFFFAKIILRSVEFWNTTNFQILDALIMVYLPI